MSTPNYDERRAAERIGELLALLETDHPEAPSNEEFAAVGRELAAKIRSQAMPGTASVSSLADARRRRQATRIPGYVDVQRAAASDDGPTQRVPVEGWDLVFSRTLTASDQTRVTISAADDTRTAGEVIKIAVADREHTADLLIVLYEDDGELVGQATTALFSLPDDLQVSVLADVDLTTDMAESVAESVRTSSAAPKARNAWRALARSLPRDHPIRQAVVRALR
jgi:prophage DNA circulation protein